MTEVKGVGNILSSSQYPRIGVNTLNLVLPCDSDIERDTMQHHMREVMGDGYEELEQFELKHPYNGSFWVFQLNLRG